MSYTYTQNIPETETETAFVPSYARRSSVKTKKVKTWMVLAPIAGAVLLGGAAFMLMNNGAVDQPQPLAEPAPAPMAASAPALLSSTPVAPVPAETVIEPQAAPVAATRTAPAEVRPAPARPAVTVRAAPPAEARPAPVEVEITGPQAYQPAPASEAPAPSISVSPLN